MIVPLTTDAPIYHRPFGTVGLILLNVLAFLFTAGSPDALARWGLVHGGGLTPLQWITSNFLHDHWLHLMGNMVFLWGFGLIVEGKLGWLRFVMLYLGLGVAECLLEQVWFSSPGSVSFGASSIIFGLMAISLIWAPRNDLTVGYWFFIVMGTFEISVLSFSALALLKSALMLALLPAESSEFVHLLGAALGAAVGFGMLWLKLVDCEGWDLLSVISSRTPKRNDVFSFEHQHDANRRTTRRKGKRKRSATRAQPEPQTPPEARLAMLIQSAKPVAAFTELQRIRHLKPDWKPPGEQLLELARGLRAVKQWCDSVEVYEAYLQLHPECAAARLELAELFVLVQERPAAAVRLLHDCDASRLSPRQQERLDRIHALARRMIDSGVIEIQGDSR